MESKKTVRIGFFKHEVSGSGPGKVIKVIGMVIMGLIGLTVLALLFGIFVRLLWNALMPGIFGLPEISFWQAVGLVVLAHIFFGGDHSHHYSRSGSSKRKSRKDDSFHREMENDYRQFWREEGREAFRGWLLKENGPAAPEE